MIPIRALRSSLFAAALLVAASAGLLAGCAPPLIAMGAAHVTMIAVDRRSTGAQLDDTAIEFKVESDAGTRWGTEIHLSVTSYNGNVLLSGEAPTPEIRAAIVEYTKKTDRVKSVYDELVVGPATDLSARTNDTYITSKVKARMIESETVKSLYVKVVTDRSVVYLMGIVSREQGDAAAKIAATTEGVARVVKLFEYTG
ncbi:MAG: BON domain-containing protein [Betaproteobacteria bacterium]